MNRCAVQQLSLSAVGPVWRLRNNQLVHNCFFLSFCSLPPSPYRTALLVRDDFFGKVPAAGFPSSFIPVHTLFFFFAVKRNLFLLLCSIAWGWGNGAACFLTLWPPGLVVSLCSGLWRGTALGWLAPLFTLHCFQHFELNFWQRPRAIKSPTGADVSKLNPLNCH